MPAIISWIDLKRRKSPRPNIALNGIIKARAVGGAGVCAWLPTFSRNKEKTCFLIKRSSLNKFFDLAFTPVHNREQQSRVTIHCRYKIQKLV